MTRLAFSVYRSNIKPYPSRVSQGEAVGAYGLSPLKFSALWSIMQSRYQRCPSLKWALGTRTELTKAPPFFIAQLVAITCTPDLQRLCFVPIPHSYPPVT